MSSDGSVWEYTSVGVSLGRAGEGGIWKAGMMRSERCTVGWGMKSLALGVENKPIAESPSKGSNEAESACQSAVSSASSERGQRSDWIASSLRSILSMSAMVKAENQPHCESHGRIDFKCLAIEWSGWAISIGAHFWGWKQFNSI